ncbi:unnamed protein product [Blepharisma stoltei]|uniref:Uncharacterized protein n=1 Tax=Blepharisma stoltei TaxID=1481888 RepID=A0AAU9JRZ4_9CILI|nr:unnamed protein product [Blepharisma stoltei]
MESILKCSASNIQHKMAEWDIKEWYLDYKDINAVISKIYEIPFNPLDKLEKIQLNEMSLAWEIISLLFAFTADFI